MNSISQKVQQWIDDGKDPRSAHWQGCLEAILDVFMPYLKPGQLIPVAPLADEEMAVFLSVLKIVDLSPNLFAAFLPPSIAEKITPPDSAEELHHIEKGKPSFKILIARPGTEERILCAEISEHANKPGVDIFQPGFPFSIWCSSSAESGGVIFSAGALLGSYNFENLEDCFTELNKIIRAHIWEKEKWPQKDYIRYTINWFEKVMTLHKDTVDVQKDFSFFHSPTLIKSNKTDVIFILIYEIIQKRLNDTDDSLQESVAAIQAIDDVDVKKGQLNSLIDAVVFELLKVMKDCDLLQLDAFSEKEMKQFDSESARTIQKIGRLLAV